MADPWGDIGNFLSQVGQAAGGALSNAGMGAGISLMHGGGLVHGALGGLLGGRRLIDAMVGPKLGGAQYQKIEYKGPHGGIVQGYRNVATGQETYLSPNESFYSTTKQTAPVPVVGPDGKATWVTPTAGQAIPGLTPSMLTAQNLQDYRQQEVASRQKAQKSLEQQREDTLRERQQEHADTEADRALQRRLVAGNEAANRDLRRDFMNTATPVSPHDLVPNPKDPEGKSSILIERDRTGRVSTRVVGMPPPPDKTGQRTGASADDINRGLDQMDKSVSLLGKNPGASAVVGGIVRHGMSLAGYPAEAEFQGQAAALSDMIPKALAGRSSQSAINNAMQYMVPSFHDTQASAQRKLKNLRALFIRAGVLPKSGVLAGATGPPATLGATTLAPADTGSGADVSDDDLLGSYRK